MGKLNRLPRESATGADEPTESNDGLGAEHDVEGHQTPAPDGFLPGMPGTGGDVLHRPSGGGEATPEDDVEGHRLPSGERFLPGMPGTGGDRFVPGTGTGGDRFHRPSGGGEATPDDDVEGHRS